MVFCKVVESGINKKLWNVAWEMWQHRNSAVYNMATGKALIVEGNTKNQVIQVYMTGNQSILQENLQLVHIPLLSTLQQDH